MPTVMSPARARETLRTQLDADLAAGASCANSTEDWFREDGESHTSWEVRRRGLIRQCTDCPVLAQCRELALRYDTTLSPHDDMVRGGLTARELAAVRDSDQHRNSLRTAVHADEQADRERAEINKTARRLNDALATVNGSSRDWLKKNSERVEALTAELAARRAVRRRRNGWTTAA